MLKFILGVLFGAGLAVGYVKYNVELPAFLQLTDKLRGSLVTSATETELYDLNADIATRRRALEIMFANRPDHAVKVDAEYGHPFLEALYRKKATRQARVLRSQWTAFDVALGKPPLRKRLAERHRTTDTLKLKQRMLVAALNNNYPFLKSWLASKGEAIGEADLMATLKRVGVLPVGALPRSGR
ncbi:MAG: hypothetical protein K0U74_15560 [Alphaproteobacteria bacterium]|nr:hypothetical protein [Alphaproteobacteria bacterium]